MRYMSSQGFNVTMISSDFQGKSKLAELEQSVFIPVNMTRAITPIADMKSLFKLIKTFRIIKPQIVHTHTPKAGLIGMLASWITGVPVRLHTVAGLPLMETNGIKRKILEFVEQLTYGCATKVYPNSRNLNAFIIQSKFTKPNKLKVIGNGSSNGIDTKAFSNTPELECLGQQLLVQHGLAADDFTFIFIGRLVKDKGIEELVQAFAVLSSIYPNLKLLLIGPEEPELDPLSVTCREEIESNPSIIAVGYQNDVRPYLTISKALVFPSYREGFPNVPMQAGCFDLPAIVTNINGCNEIIVEKENGLIIPVKDAEALRSAMECLYLNQQLYQDMSKKARQMIVDRYDQQKVWELILEEYELQLKEKGIVHQRN